MIGLGSYDDNFNSISFSQVYALNTDFPTDIGAPSSVQTITAPTNDTPSTGAQPMATTTPGNPANWWVMFALIFAGFILLARKFSNDDRYSNIRASTYNLVFLTFFIILILNVMKRIAAAVRPNPISALILAA